MRKSLFILGQLTDLDVEWLIAHGRRQQISRGVAIIRQGQRTGSLFLTLSGRFSVVDEQRGRELAQVQSGEFLGEMSFIDAAPPSATVTAIDEGIVLAVECRVLQSKLDIDAPFASRFYRAIALFLSDRLRSTVSRMAAGEQDAPHDNDAMEEDELDMNVLDNVHLAGARFERIVKRMMEG